MLGCRNQALCGDSWKFLITTRQGSQRSMWVELLKEYQTLVVGFVALIGVAWTLRGNAKLSRSQRLQELQHERSALRIALTAELQINRDSFEDNSRKLVEGPPEGDGGVFVPTDLMDGVYRSFLPRIGVLSGHEVSKVLGAYLSIQTHNAKLFLIGTPVPTNPRHVLVPVVSSRMLAAMQESMLEPVDAAIAALSERRSDK